MTPITPEEAARRFGKKPSEPIAPIPAPVAPAITDNCAPPATLSDSADGSPLVWRREPPDRPGWWWRHQEGWAAPELLHCYYYGAAGFGGIKASEFEYAHEDFFVVDMSGGWWAGPLTAPPPPDCQESNQAPAPAAEDSTSK